MRTSLSTLMLAAATLFVVSPASALTVQYDTIGTTFTCAGCTGSGTSSISFVSGSNNVKIDYTPQASIPNVDAPTNGSFGEIKFTTLSGSLINFNATLNLLINQTLPTAGSGNLAGKIAGQVKFNTNTGKLEFSPTNTVTIGGVTYELDTNIRLVPTSTNAGVITIQGFITAVPEPGFYVLSTAGLVGLLTFARRRSLTQVQ